MTELSPDDQALIDLARGGDDPSPRLRMQMRAETMAKIGIGAGAAAGTLGAAGVAFGKCGAVAGGTGTGVAAKAASGMSVSSKLLVGVIGLVVAGGGGGLVYESTRADAPPQAASPSQVEVAPPAEEAAPPPLDAPRVVVAAAPDEAGAEPPRGDVEPAKLEPRPAPAPARASSSSDTSIVGELALLRSAQQSLQSGKPAQALAALDAHEKKFGAGSLGEERMAARVFALCELGREAEARAAAARFVAASPKSPLAPRVARACAKKP